MPDELDDAAKAAPAAPDAGESRQTTCLWNLAIWRRECLS
jgi:hypothetical protein